MGVDSCFNSKIPTIFTLSPGLAESTRSSSRITSIWRGNWPAGISSGLSWSTPFCQSTILDFSGRNLNCPPFPCSGHSAGASRTSPISSSPGGHSISCSINSPASLSNNVCLNTAFLILCLIGVCLTRIPSIAISFSTSVWRIFLSSTTLGMFTNLRLTFSTSSLKEGSRWTIRSYRTFSSCGMISLGLLSSSEARVCSKTERWAKSITKLLFLYAMISLIWAS